MKLRAIALFTFVSLMFLYACPPGWAAPHTVKLSWTPPAASTIQTGVTITGYKIYRGTAAGAEGTTAYAAVNGTTTTFTDAAVAAGTSYFYKITAVATCDNTVLDCTTNYTLVSGAWVAESGPSNEAASGVVPKDTAIVPGAPSAATAVVQ